MNKYNSLEDNWIRGGNLVASAYIVQLVPMMNASNEKEVWVNVIRKGNAEDLHPEKSIVQSAHGRRGRYYFHF